MDNGFTLLLIVLCLVMLSMTLLRRTHARQATARELTREQLARLRDQKHIQQSMEELLLQLEDVSRRINAQVDTKLVKLEQVIRDADTRIAELRRLQGQSTPAGPSSDAPQANPSESADEFQPGLGQPSNPPASPPAPAPPSNRSESSGTSASSEPPTLATRRQRVYELADAGTAPMTIADLLRIPLGEVELLLNLRGYR